VVGGEFQALKQPDHPAAGQHAEFDEDGRPQVADLHDQPGPLGTVSPSAAHAAASADSRACGAPVSGGK
jgi:hypothetical protein